LRHVAHRDVPDRNPTAAKEKATTNLRDVKDQACARQTLAGPGHRPATAFAIIMTNQSKWHDFRLCDFSAAPRSSLDFNSRSKKQWQLLKQSDANANHRIRHLTLQPAYSRRTAARMKNRSCHRSSRGTPAMGGASAGRDQKCKRAALSRKKDRHRLHSFIVRHRAAIPRVHDDARKYLEQ